MNQIQRLSNHGLLFLMITMTTLTMAPVQAGAILPSVAVYGGLSHPLGNASSSWGLRGNLYLALAPFLTIGPEVGYYDFKENTVAPSCPDCVAQSKSRVVSYGAALRFGPPLPALHPYAVVGLGGYAWKGWGAEPDKNVLGMSAGLGFDLGPALSPVKLSVEGRWHGKAGAHTAWRGERNLTTFMVGLTLTLL